MKVLVACEESQRVCIEFRKLGHEAYSCDVEPCSGGHPEWHIQNDVLPLLNGRCNFKTMDGEKHRIDTRWDMIIAFPPCTYLSNAGAKHLWKDHVLNKERYMKGLEAKKFFMQFLNADCLRVAVENPVSSRIFSMPPHTQEIQPYQFGHPVQKKTRLWLRGLPELKPTNEVNYKCGCHEAGTWFMKGGKGRQKNRSKTFPGVAKAMAGQWGGKTVGLLEDIKMDLEGKRTKTEEERSIKRILDSLFYLPKIKQESDLVLHILTRGGDTEERKGLHASMILEDEKIFCYRKCVLAALYRQKQKEHVSSDLLRVFEEGNAVHEKWQRLFLRGSLTDIANCDTTRYSDIYGILYSPDIIAEIEGERYVIEIKSMCSMAYRKMLTTSLPHAKAELQAQLYMFLTGIKKAVILCENKDTQEFDVCALDYNPDKVSVYGDRMNDVSKYMDRLFDRGKMIDKHNKCVGYDCKLASDCPMRDVCYKKVRGERL